jgi:hypothetical protein
MEVLKLGKRGIIRLLLYARTVFEADWSVYTRIIWEDYIIWAQGCKERVLIVLAEEMEKVEVDLGDIEFTLNQIHNVLD